MYGTVSRALGVAAAALALATAAQAQGRGHEHGHGHDHDQDRGSVSRSTARDEARGGTTASTQRSVYGSNRSVYGSNRSVYGSNRSVYGSNGAVYGSNGDVERDGDHDGDREGHGRRGNYGAYRMPGNGMRIPPGLAKKPGQMPPGQYRKRYSAAQGAGVLGDILRRRGYTVDRIAPLGASDYVYYRSRYGREQRAIVSPGADQLLFQNVPQALLQEVLSRLY